MATWRGSARTRAIGSVVLVVLACLLAFVSVIAVWTRALVLNTDSYVRAVGPLLEKPALRDELSVKIVDALYARVDVPLELLEDALPKKADVLAPTLAQGIHDTSIKLASAALATDAVQAVWEKANRVAHDQVVRVLEGKGTVVTTDEGEVAVELGPLAAKVREALDANGVHLFDSVPVASLDRQFVLFRSADLEKAQRWTKILSYAVWLPFLALAAFAGAIALARHRRRALGACTLALAGTMVVLTIAIVVGRSFYLDHVGNEISRAAAAVPFDGLVRPLRFWTRVVFLGSIALWFATWFAGSREAIAREREVRVAAARVIRAHGRVLAGAGVIVAALLLVAWDKPSPRAVFGVLVLLGLWEVGLRVLAHEPDPGPSLEA